MIHLVRSQQFDNEKEVEASVKEFLVSKAKKCLQYGIKELAESRLQMMQNNGPLWMLVLFKLEE